MTLLQLTEFKPLVFSWSAKPLEGEGQEMATVPTTKEAAGPDARRADTDRADKGVGALENAFDHTGLGSCTLFSTDPPTFAEVFHV